MSLHMPFLLKTCQKNVPTLDVYGKLYGTFELLFLFNSKCLVKVCSYVPYNFANLFLLGISYWKEKEVRTSAVRLSIDVTSHIISINPHVSLSPCHNSKSRAYSSLCFGESESDSKWILSTLAWKRT